MYEDQDCGRTSMFAQVLARKKKKGAKAWRTSDSR